MAKIFGLPVRKVYGPFIALTMAGMLYVYSRSSIQAAKRNAARHRAADGGQISWQNENLRRHGKLERPAEEGFVKEVFNTAKEKVEEIRGKGNEAGRRREESVRAELKRLREKE